MTPNMTAIQIALLDIMKACVTELKQCNASVSFCFKSTHNWYIQYSTEDVNMIVRLAQYTSMFIAVVNYTSFAFVLLPQLDTDEVSVENCMSRSFDQIVKLQLDPIWNQLVGICCTNVSCS